MNLNWRHIKDTVTHLLSSDSERATHVLDRIAEKHESIERQVRSLEERLDPLEKIATDMRGRRADEYRR
jgi:hypothetical protein